MHLTAVVVVEGGQMVGSWQRCEQVSCRAYRQVRNVRGIERTACSFCGLVREMVEVYGCINKQCEIGPFKKLQLKEMLNNDLLCSHCGSVLLPHRIYRILPA